MRHKYKWQARVIGVITIVAGLSPALIVPPMAYAHSFATAEEAEDKATVRTFLNTWDQSKLISDDAFKELHRKLGDKTLMLLAEFLPDPRLGFLAQSAMLEIDATGAQPFMIRNLPHVTDENIRRDTFRSANLQFMRWQLKQRATASAERKLYESEPGHRPGYVDRDIAPYPYGREIREAAANCIRQQLDKPGAWFSSEMVRSLGYFGRGKDDRALLRRVAAGASLDGGPMMSDPKVAALGALACLGDREAIEKIAAALREPVTPEWARDDPRDGPPVATEPPRPLHLVTPLATGRRLDTAAMLAAYTMDEKRWAKLLVRHLSDPPGAFHGDYGDPSPAYSVMNALGQLVFGGEGYGSIVPKERWRSWWKERGAHTDGGGPADADAKPLPPLP